MLRPDLHLGEKAIDEIDGVEEDVVGQVVPHLKAAQDVSGSVARSDGDLAVLGEGEKQKKCKKSPQNSKRDRNHLHLIAGVKIDSADISAPMPRLREVVKIKSPH